MRNNLFDPGSVRLVRVEQKNFEKPHRKTHQITLKPMPPYAHVHIHLKVRKERKGTEKKKLTGAHTQNNSPIQETKTKG